MKNANDRWGMKKDLEEFQKKGIPLYLDKKIATPDEIVKICLREDTCYMADYVINDDGELEAIRYDDVSRGCHTKRNQL